MKKRTVKIAVTVPATPDAVFAALTDSRKIAQWSGQKGKVTPKVGGTFEMFDGWAKGKVLEYKPGRSLAYTWVTEDWGETAGESVVRYAFAPAKTGTKVILEHSNLPDENEMKSHKAGWKEHVFDPLNEYFSS